MGQSWSQTLIQDRGRKTSLLSYPLWSPCHSQCSFVLLNAEQLAPSLDRCQMRMGATDWLITSVYLGCTLQTDGLHSKAERGFPQGQSHQYRTMPLDGGRRQQEGVRWGGRCPLGADRGNVVVNCNAAPGGFKQLP